MKEPKRRGPMPDLKPIAWNTCCQAVGFHRFDCKDSDPRKRADGPYAPPFTDN